MKLKQITIRMESKRGKQFEEAWGLLPLSEVVEKAVGVINMSGITAQWIAGMALRAVSEAIVARGNMPFPLRVQLEANDNMLSKNKAGFGCAEKSKIAVPACKVANVVSEREYSWESLDGVLVPDVFPKLAEYYHQKADILASLLIIDFCQRPPKKLTIVERADAGLEATRLVLRK
jgi:hypothetical protein